MYLCAMRYAMLVCGMLKWACVPHCAWPWFCVGCVKATFGDFTWVCISVAYSCEAALTPRIMSPFLLALHAEYIFFHTFLPHEVTHDKTIKTSAWEATFYTKFTISLGCINRYTCCGWESGATEVSAGKTKYITNPFDTVYSCTKINDYVFLSSGHFLCVFKWCLSEGCKCSRSQVYQGWVFSFILIYRFSHS